MKREELEKDYNAKKDECFSFLAEERKAEIRRIAELVYTSLPEVPSVKASVAFAKHFVDNFDAEFEKLEGEK
jgi:hypothetical protein